MKYQLINAVIDHQDRISYINLNAEAQYLGWTHDFNIMFPDGAKMGLDLRTEEDLFCCLCWPLPGHEQVNGKMRHFLPPI